MTVSWHDFYLHCGPWIWAGIACIVVATCYFAQHFLRLSNQRNVVGRVSRLTGENASLVAPMIKEFEVEFETETGTTMKSHVCLVGNHPTGEAVPLLYNLRNPNEATLNHWLFKHPEMLLFAFGLLPFLFFVLMNLTLWLSCFGGIAFGD